MRLTFLVTHFKLTNAEIGEMLGKSRDWVRACKDPARGQPAQLAPFQWQALMVFVAYPAGFVENDLAILIQEFADNLNRVKVNPNQDE